jgi:hypothetical protein
MKPIGTHFDETQRKRRGRERWGRKWVGAAEVMALFQGVSLCISLGFQNVFVEGDAKTEGEEKKEEERDGEEEENGFPECSLGCGKKKGREREMGKKTCG